MFLDKLFTAPNFEQIILYKVRAISCLQGFHDDFEARWDGFLPSPRIPAVIYYIIDRHGTIKGSPYTHEVGHFIRRGGRVATPASRTWLSEDA